MNRVELATALFEENWTCSQAIMAAYCGEVGLECETAVTLGRGFSGGISRLGRTCGVVSAAVMILSFQGEDAPDEPRGWLPGGPGQKDVPHHLSEVRHRRGGDIGGVVVGEMPCHNLQIFPKSCIFVNEKVL